MSLNPQRSSLFCCMLIALAGTAFSQAFSNSATDDWMMGFHDSRHTGTSSEIINAPLTQSWTWKDTLANDVNNTAYNQAYGLTRDYWLPLFYRGKIFLQGGLNSAEIFCLSASGQ